MTKTKIVLATGAGLFVILFFFLVICFPRPFPTETQQFSEIQKSIDENEKKLQEAEQGVWNIQRDLCNLTLQIWVTDMIRHHQTFSLTHIETIEDFSPMTDWMALLDSWVLWLQKKIIIREVSNPV
jgi:hypothetical protein